MPDFRTAVEAEKGNVEGGYPQGIVSDYFRCQLALKLGLTLSEMNHGRGAPMSDHELTVVWPAFFRAENEITKHRIKEAEDK